MASGNRQPLLALSPSQFAYQRPAPNQDTPKLPLRDRLASSNRLLTTGHFAALFPDEFCAGGVRRQKPAPTGDHDRVARCPSPVQLFVSECERNQETENREDGRREDRALLRVDGNRGLDSTPLPFSPKLSRMNSPIALSPHYRQPTPTKSPLYTPDRKNTFLGRGAFGNVKLYQHKGTDFALKVIHQNYSRAIGEFHLLEVKHPHLVRVVHIVRVMQRYFICMEFAGRCNLQQILETKSELDLHRKLSFCMQIASGLGHCHKLGIVHGDVKAANVLVSPHGICKLGDFGNSVKLDSSPSHPPFPGDFIGTATYAAPEVLMGRSLALPSDVYSYGILLWQMYTRQTPFAGEHPHVVIYKVVHYGARPNFETPENNELVSTYIDLTKSCWSEDTKARPTTKEILVEVQEMLKMVKEYQ